MLKNATSILDAKICDDFQPILLKFDKIYQDVDNFSDGVGVVLGSQRRWPWQTRLRV